MSVDGSQSSGHLGGSQSTGPVQVHTLRHTTASLLKVLGIPAKDAQVILGHAHASTTQQIYTHVDQAAMRDAITKLNLLLGGSDE